MCFPGQLRSPLDVAVRPPVALMNSDPVARQQLLQRQVNLSRRCLEQFEAICEIPALTGFPGLPGSTPAGISGRANRGHYSYRSESIGSRREACLAG
jgi:hypothetical protein